MTKLSYIYIVEKVSPWSFTAEQLPPSSAPCHIHHTTPTQVLCTFTTSTNPFLGLSAPRTTTCIIHSAFWLFVYLFLVWCLFVGLMHNAQCRSKFLSRSHETAIILLTPTWQFQPLHPPTDLFAVPPLQLCNYVFSNKIAVGKDN